MKYWNIGVLASMREASKLIGKDLSVEGFSFQSWFLKFCFISSWWGMRNSEKAEEGSEYPLAIIVVDWKRCFFFFFLLFRFVMFFLYVCYYLLHVVSAFLTFSLRQHKSLRRGGEDGRWGDWGEEYGILIRRGTFWRAKRIYLGCRYVNCLLSSA